MIIFPRGVTGSTTAFDAVRLGSNPSEEVWLLKN